MCTSAMSVWGSVCACKSVCVRVPVSQSLCLVSSVWPASVGVYNNLWCRCLMMRRNWPPRTWPTPFNRSSDWIHSSHRRSDAESVRAGQLQLEHVHITTMSMPRIKAKRLSNATDWDRLWPYWESRQHWCGHWDRRAWRRMKRSNTEKKI